MLVAVRLAKQGYYDGDPQKVLNAPVDVVEAIISYENFEIDYKEEYLRLNKKAE